MKNDFLKILGSAALVLSMQSEANGMVPQAPAANEQSAKTLVETINEALKTKEIAPFTRMFLNSLSQYPYDESGMLKMWLQDHDRLWLEQRGLPPYQTKFEDAVIGNLNQFAANHPSVANYYPLIFKEGEGSAINFLRESKWSDTQVGYVIPWEMRRYKRLYEEYLSLGNLGVKWFDSNDSDEEMYRFFSDRDEKMYRFFSDKAARSLLPF